MNNLCEEFKDDILIGKMKENINKQKIMINNEKNGVKNNMNIKAFAKNINNCFEMQESCPNQCEGMYINKSKMKKSSMLQTVKKAKLGSS